MRGGITGVLVALSFVSLAAVAAAQQAPVPGAAPAAAPAALPADVDSTSLSRLPFVDPSTLSGEALRVYESLYPKDKDGNRRRLFPGMTSLSLVSPGFAEAIDSLHLYLSQKSVIGQAMFQLCSLIAIREFDDPFNWNAHEGQAARAGVDQRTIDAIKFDRPVDGLPEKDALAIRFGRAIFREHEVSSELYARVVKAFGRQGMMELDATMGTYALVSMVAIGVDEHVQNPRYVLPVLPRK